MASVDKPPTLHPGDRIAVIAPASPPKEPSHLEAGIATLRQRGYEVETSRPFTPHGYLCGTDEVRLNELNGFLQRTDVKALFCARGGFGSMRLLPHIDYEAARAHPKLLIGYSDITALHMALYERARLPGLSGPMVAVEWKDPDPDTERLFWQLARGETPQPLLGPGDEVLKPVRPGAAEGMLLGGNLSMIQRLIGTPYLPSLEGALLFVEEIGEQPYQLDALFAQLRMAGLLGKLGGLLLGSFTDWQPSHDRPTLSPDEVIDDYTRDAPFPVARGLIYGHFPIKSTLPVGVRARLEVNERDAALSILEPAAR